MPAVDILVSTDLDRTHRVRQLEAMFDVPAKQKLSHHWKGDVPLDDRQWNIGAIVGPSGAGKSSIARQMFGDQPQFAWKAKAVIDDFDSRHSIEKIADICQAVGFNTIPSWMKPYQVLSTGEKFRVELARHLLEDADPIVIDEFTSVVDRQVAKIGSHAVQKYIRHNARKFVAVSCHYDIIDWLQPDWMLEPTTMIFQWRSVQRRPDINIEIARVDYSAWRLFAPFHYLTAELHKAAQCFVLFCDGLPAAFAGVLHRPHAKVDDIKGVSRVVCLPDYQGIGLAFVLLETLAAAYGALGFRFRNYPAHPAFVRAHDRSSRWAMVRKPGAFSATNSPSSTIISKIGGRPCAVFEYVGAPMASAQDAARLLGMSSRISIAANSGASG
jgi:ABC-type Mn2+/Zn2+ transport system ATPase subunit/GNAT superfamily N-acetyltransferase